MKKTTIRNVAIASGIAALSVLGVGIANPTALVPTTHQVIQHLEHTGKLAVPSAHPLSGSDNDPVHNHTGFVEISDNKVYVGQPILAILGTTWPTASLDAPGAKIKVVRPIISQWQSQNYAETITQFLPSHDTPQLDNYAGHFAVGYWQLIYATPGKHDITVNLGGGHVHTASITVVPLPAKYHDVQYRGVAESTTMQLGIDPSGEQPANWPWAFVVKVSTNHTHFSHSIPRVTQPWSVPFTIHANERGEIVERLTTPSYPSNGSLTSPAETFTPQAAATPNYLATYSVPTPVTEHGTTPVRFWSYWLGHYNTAQSWTWQPTLYAEWEWLALAGLFALMSLLGGVHRPNKGDKSSQTTSGGKAAL
ncbi:hypothetical protein JI721_03005 [Alicyclobacillus cycloheptanicus]|uniref:Uncharacterized protein n=1 Tax=Alicyclobacillus cycloheptanicus TaxID=1457 RepID=A0ABT9XJZ2_9BACL|nr:hypothetical protein [Alicyclobacillus cycloheptanicus]MDQ0190630.1 hypothetical protein [Alicyclobacillus cycloheptanicus]WDM01830.1 hypothetical protein JI721_03005 [Alicyclobacillus cycloheptanicus]